MTGAGVSPAGVSNEDGHPRLSELLGHENVVASIGAPDATRRHHGYLLTGDKGIGKATAAYRIAERLLSPDTAHLVRAGTHPDLLTIEADTAGKATTSISVDQIRMIVPFLSHTPSFGASRVVIIDALDEMNLNGANAMLKTLEEPPAHAFILVINHGSRPVLPTIRSRVQVVSFKPLSPPDCTAIIKSRFPDADEGWIAAAAFLSEGSPGRGDILASSGSIDFYTETCQLLSNSSPNPLEIDRLADSWGAGGAKNLARRQMFLYLADRLINMAARRAAGIYSPSNLVIEEAAISALAARHSPATLAEIHQDTLALSEAERFNLDTVGIVYRVLERLS